MANQKAGDRANKAFSGWCVMAHARPALLEALRAWGLSEAAARLEQAASLNALRLLAGGVTDLIRKQIRFIPLRRDLSHAAMTLQVAATFAARGDAENNAAVLICVFIPS